tara:strand:+ start:491 stop:691 length:201 start_codon:yes stop_codon:yes gene_type:complete
MKKIYIEGTLDIDGETSNYSISNYEAWFQWGATQERLCKSVNIVEGMQNKLNEENPYFENEEDENI